MKASNDETTLIGFIRSLPTVKAIRVYKDGAEKALPPSDLSPAVRRLMIREANTCKGSNRS